MATTKSATSKTTSKKTTGNNELEKQVKSLTNELAALRAEIHSLKNTSATSGDFATREQVCGALRSMGARSWMLKSAGLK